MTPTASASTTIAASPETVYRLVSDLPRMGEWSPEATGGRWIGRTPAGEVGAKFLGSNRGARRWWATTVVVTDARPGKRFAFDNKLGPVTAAQWAYEIEPTEEGCRVTETWTDQRNKAIVTVGRVLTGVSDRKGHTESMLASTLAKLKATAEA